MSKLMWLNHLWQVGVALMTLDNLCKLKFLPLQLNSRQKIRDFGIKCDSITNIQRLLPHTTEGSMVQPSGSHPLPVIFTVSSFALKKQILQKSFEKKGEIQFRNNASREDCASQNTLKEELKARTDAGEINLAIHGFHIVSKKNQAIGKHPNSSWCPCSTKPA